MSCFDSGPAPALLRRNSGSSCRPGAGKHTGRGGALVDGLSRFPSPTSPPRGAGFTGGRRRRRPLHNHMKNSNDDSACFGAAGEYPEQMEQNDFSHPLPNSRTQIANFERTLPRPHSHSRLRTQTLYPPTHTSRASVSSSAILRSPAENGFHLKPLSRRCARCASIHTSEKKRGFLELRSHQLYSQQLAPHRAAGKQAVNN